MIAVVDGVLTSSSDATVSALDRGAWYGDAAFESFRTFDRKVVALDARFARLGRSLERLSIPSAGLEAALRRDLADALLAHPDRDAYVRLAVSRGVGAGGLIPRGDERPTRCVFALPLPSFPASYATNGLSVVTRPSAIVVPGMRAAGAKLASYVEPMLASIEARVAGADDAIGLDRDGLVLEATTSNVFVRLGRTWFTPPTSTGVLPGVTRALVLGFDLASGPVREKCFTVHDLYRAEEIVLTSSIRGPVAATRIDGHAVGAGLPGEGFREIEGAYRDLVARTALTVDGTPDSR